MSRIVIEMMNMVVVSPCLLAEIKLSDPTQMLAAFVSLQVIFHADAPRWDYLKWHAQPSGVRYAPFQSDMRYEGTGCPNSICLRVHYWTWEPIVLGLWYAKE